MDENLLAALKTVVKGTVKTDEESLKFYSHDASILELKPQVVVEVQDKTDIENLVKFAIQNKAKYPNLSLTVRAAGTDMSGGPLSESVLIALSPHLNKIGQVEGSSITVEPGAYFRDFEKVTSKQNMVFPSYPVSKEICAIGGMIGNNCGGEKSFEFGKVERYVETLKVVLSDGNEYEFKKLGNDELKEKMSLNSFEGDLYRNVYRLISDNYELLQNAHPHVTKNSSGYSLWNVYDKDSKTFDMIQLFVGSQGTLGIVTEAKLKLVPVRKYSQMVVMYLTHDHLKELPEIINTVIPLKPESFETYDDNTLKLAVKYYPEFANKLGTSKFGAFIKFLPEIIMNAAGKIPTLVLQAEFTGNDNNELSAKVTELLAKLKPFNLKVKVAANDKASLKYWLIRRESFALLKNKIKDMHASPFIDDIAVEPKYLADFMPKLNQILDKYPSIITTVAGHIGDGNFHIIPLVKLEEQRERDIVKNLGKEVFDLVYEYHGTTSGEHNDGLIRAPYIRKMYGGKIYDLFVETKKIFDPLGIFNPGKKAEASVDFVMSHIRVNWK